MSHSIQTRALPAQPFFATPQQRVELARQRFFEDGVRPSGLVSEAVIQSWTRCLQAGHDPRRTPAFKTFLRDFGYVEYWRAHGDWGDFCRPLSGDDFECR